MDSKFKFDKWKVNNFSKTRDGYSFRCLQNRLGSILPDHLNKGILVTGEIVSTYKHARVEGSKIFNSNICKGKTNLVVHIQMNNETALAYLMKMGETKILLLIRETKEIWEVCMSQEITLTAECLPGVKNTKADEAPREVQRSSSEWILCRSFKRY